MKANLLRSLSAGLKAAAAVEIPAGSTVRQTASIMHRACVEHVAAALAVDPNVDIPRFCRDSGLRPPHMLMVQMPVSRSKDALPFDPPD